MSFHICVQARLSSTRLPYKILLPVDCSLNSNSIIQNLLCTTVKLNMYTTLLAPFDEEHILRNLAFSLRENRLINNVFFGDNHNVMKRYRKDFLSLSATDIYIVRLCADSPCITSQYLQYIISCASDLFLSTDSLLVTTRNGIGYKGFNVDIFHPLFWSNQSVINIISSLHDDLSLLEIISSLGTQVTTIHGDILKYIDQRSLNIGAIDTPSDYSNLLSSSIV